MNSTVLSKLEGNEMGLYDNRDPQNKSVVASKVVDITVFCPKAEARAVLKYARVTRGPIVQLNDWYEKDKDLGAGVHYHYEEMGEEGLASDSVFVHFATDYWGINPCELARIVFENAPAN